MRLLAISGSLRSASSNTTLLRAVVSLAEPPVEASLSTLIGELPLFNPDLEANPPESVTAWRAELAAADGFLICTPEYAHGLPGALKNALDWIVRSGEFMEKPFALLIATPPTPYAEGQILETLKVMMAINVPEANVTLPLRGKSPDGSPLLPETILENPDYRASLSRSLQVLHKYWLKNQQG